MSEKFERFKAVCQKAKRNNGTVEVLLLADYSDPDAYQLPLHGIFPLSFGRFEVNREYFVTIQPVGPRGRNGN